MSKNFLHRIDQVANKVLNSPAQTPTGHQVSAPYSFTALAPPSFPSCPGTSILMDCRSEVSLTVDNYARGWTGRDIRSRSRGLSLSNIPQLLTSADCSSCVRCDEGFLITIDILPDDVLLEIFDFHLRDQRGIDSIERWITLAHVCRRWRTVVFQSPLRLDLHLDCTPKTRARDTLEIWPPLPLVIHYNCRNDNETIVVDNIIAALEHNHRVRQIELFWFSGPEWEYVANSAAMRKPFPELTDLMLMADEYDESGPILPDSFLGGTAPRLESLHLELVPFPGLPRLLLSATHLVYLQLDDIPRSGYIPPEAMATSLSALTSLESLHLLFYYPPPRPALGSRHPPPLTHSILPNLTHIQFRGTSEYFEEILARIDAPRLNNLDITFFNQLIFNTPQLFRLINRRPTLRTLKKGYITFSDGAIRVRFPLQTSEYRGLSVGIGCTASDWQLSSLAQVCASSLPPVSTLEDLYILEDQYWGPDWQDDVENTLWLDLLRSFPPVKNLYLSREFVPRIAPALEELVGGRTTEVLPALENIFSEEPPGSIHKGVQRFISARRLTSHPVAVSTGQRMIVNSCIHVPHLCPFDLL